MKNTMIERKSFSQQQELELELPLLSQNQKPAAAVLQALMTTAVE